MKSFLQDIEKQIPTSRIYTDEMRRLAWGTDAGFYRLIPQIVIHSENETEVTHILNAANKYNLPVTFRAAGTSLSGQAITNSILVIAGKNWEKYELATDKTSIKLQPGIVGQRVNEILKPFGKKFPPDPASVKSAMVGGIILNNASGMSCGTHENSYKTIISARLIFADGTLLDTADTQSKENFRQSHPDFINKICELRDKVKGDKELSELIERKYRIKNVTGLSINPFIEFEDPFDIILHLIVGSEGTLAFLSEATMRTVTDYPFKASAMLYFPNMRTACEAVTKLKKSPVTAVEMFDRLAIKSVEDKPNAIPELKTLPAEAAVLLIKTEADNSSTLKQYIDEVTAVISKFDTLHPTRFTDIESEYSAYWTMRSGIFPTVGSTRPIGTTCLIEDVAFQVDDLPQATADLREILIKHDYSEAVIYGHALEGNYHFIINQSFDKPEEVSRYEHLMNDVIDLVVDKYQGSLKAEHGTGRNMAPFVKKEWGEKAFQLMKDVKQLFDPKGLLNPGVIFNDDPNCHLKNIKPLPETHELIDKCIE
jgi:D-lactate dehydrogenase